MPDFTTVFEIARNSNGVWADLAFRCFVGVAVLLGGVRGLVVKWKKREMKNCIAPLFAIGWSVFWIYLHNFPVGFEHINSLVRAYRNGEYQVAEGPVRVLHEQPATGHSQGDIIAVNGQEFEVNYFYATPAYRKTLAHGGVLAGGVYARIYHHNGEILRVDLRR